LMSRLLKKPARMGSARTTGVTLNHVVFTAQELSAFMCVGVVASTVRTISSIKALTGNSFADTSWSSDAAGNGIG
jgi:hypothetical protein